MGRIVLFQRVSTLEQHLESQEDVLRRAAIADGYKEDDFIIIGKKESAIKLSEEEREGIKELKLTIEQESVDCIYITELSRLSRNVEVLYSLRKYLLDKKIQLKCLKPSFTLLNDDRTKYDTHSNLIFSIFGTLAEQEMVEKKERFARGKKQKAKEGKYCGGRIPFGYRAYKDNDNIIDIDEKEAELVKRIYNMYEEGHSQTKIAIELRERGYFNPRYSNHRILQLGQIANILKNPCYTGELIQEKIVKERVKGGDREYTRYERRFPQIITVEQYNKCRDIAKANRTISGKGKNIYYAAQLVRCPDCGCFWSASGSKVNYHCYNAARPSRIWAVNGRTTQQCGNRTTLSINILDSVLWYFAKREEAGFILAASNEQIEKYKKEISDCIIKKNEIPIQIGKIKADIEKLALRNAEGHISDDTFDKKVAEKNKEKNELLNKILSYQKRIEELKKAIAKIEKNQKEYGVKDKNRLWSDLWKENSNGFTKQYNEIYNHLCGINNDAERYEIIHRMIEKVRVSNEIIRYRYKIGWKNTKAKRIDITMVNWQAYIYKDGWEPRKRIYCVYYLPFNGKDYGLFLESDMMRSVDAFLIKDGVADFIGYDFCWEWLKDYSKSSEAQFEYQKMPEKVRIIDIPYLNRYTDSGKNKRRAREKEETYKPVEGYLRMEDVMKICGLNYNQVYSAIRNGELIAQMIKHKFFISPQDANDFARKRKRHKA